MEIFFVNAENFKLDGGACFGVVPKSIWSKIYPPDENNMVTFALRELLVKDGDRLILFDTGVGNKQDEKFRSHFYIDGYDNLVNAIKEHGFSPDDITDVVHTHLHFDHCGGTYRKNESNETVPVFQYASLWCSRRQWNWANDPNPREKASYLHENLLPMEKSGRLKFIEKEMSFSENIFLKIVGGHTDGQIIPMIRFMGQTLVYMADFIPTAAHISLSFVASYDTRPLLSLEEKQIFLNEAADQNYLLLFQHDTLHECCTVHLTEKGVRVREKGTFDYVRTKSVGFNGK
ncbi:MAG TPA: MBL fold metallo-hydrolase [Bacteroidales bacterium]|nr:MBL fold metallo-hydrolase [Bacteroidales bacterium]